ncbi:hypothetical protein ABZ502_16575 [Streptomyces abikoensis]|uniref:hypothetical protein n=1 Tax=Streptomyces abikoensis TaxID=97398 RepID=UPI003404A777
MSGEQVAPTSTPPRVLNPLWIISLFLGLSETTVGVATVQSNGWAQAALALFAVTFPVLVSAAFFAILWKKPEVLYAPGDFPEHVPVMAYVDGMRRGSAVNTELLESVVQDTLQTVLPSFLSNTATPAQVTEMVEQAVASAHEGLARRMLTIDLSLTHPTFQDFRAEFPLAETATVRDLLDGIWHILRHHVKPFTYGSQWILMDRKNGRVFNRIGTQWANEHLGLSSDTRSLKEVEIHATMDLAVLLLQQ